MMATARWYAVATQPRHEKVVTGQLETAGVEVFLPLMKAPSRWKDRRVTLERPIFPGYVFTRIDLDDRRRVYSVPGVVRMISFNGKPAEIDESEIEAVRTCLTQGVRPEPHSFLTSGEKVRVISGVLQGVEGVVLRQKNELRIVVSISLIQQSISVEVDAHSVELIEARRVPVIEPRRMEPAFSFRVNTFGERVAS